MTIHRAPLSLLAASACLIALGQADCGQILGLSDFSTCKPTDVDPPCEPGSGGASGLCAPGTQRACYDGDAASRDKGICRSGMETCGINGIYGPCTGEVLPKPTEDCSNDADDDCNGKVNDGCPCTPGSSAACYDGAVATKTKGECHAGTATCNADGNGFGPCSSERLPAPEDYTARGDENCDGIPSADTLWVDAFSPTPFDSAIAYAEGAVADAAGNVYISGAFLGSLLIGSAQLVSDPSNIAGFLAKLDPNGDVIWARQLGLIAPYLAIDPVTGNLIAASVTPGVDLGLGALPEGIVVATLDTSGNVLSNLSCPFAGPAGGIELTSVVVDPTGAATLAGSFIGNLTCGSLSVTSARSDATSVFFVRLDATQTPQWFNSYGDSSAQDDSELSSVALAADGTIWATGSFEGTVQFDSTHVIFSHGEDDMMLVHLDAAGNALRCRGYGGPGSEYGGTVAIDPMTGSVYTTGTVRSTTGGNDTLNFGGTDLPAIGTDDVVFVGFDSAGEFLWNARFAASGSAGAGVLQEPNGQLLLFGTVDGRINLGNGDFVTDSARYTWAARFAPQAPPTPPELVWSKFYGNKAFADASTLGAGTLAPRVDGSGQSDVVLIGQFTEPTDFGTGALVGPAEGDPYVSGFVMRVAP